MSCEALRSARRRTVGTKQTAKALERGEVKVVYLAEDADERVIRDIKNMSLKHQIPIVYIDTMIELGKACGIEVGAASAAILKD